MILSNNPAERQVREGNVLNEERADMGFAALKELRAKSPAWRLLAAEHGPLAAAFFYEVFLQKRTRALPEEKLLDALTSFLYETGAAGNTAEFARQAGSLLLSWSDEQHRWLRRFYGPDNEVLYDLTSDAQKAVEWLAGLHHRPFIGTESRLRTVFSLLHEVERETDRDPQHRMDWLRRQKDAIEREMAAIEASGRVEPALSAVQVKERFLQAVQTSEGLLADFREVEENFRLLEHRLMTDVMTWKQGKGDLLEEIFAQRDVIRQSEQGQSFEAFWRFLMTGFKKEDFRATLAHLEEVPELCSLLKEHPLGEMMQDWLRAAAAVEQTVGALDKQIRRFVDEHTLQEERYIYELIGRIEQRAAKLPEVPNGPFTAIDGMATSISLPMDRRMFVLPKRTRLRDQDLIEGVADGPVTALLRERPIDRRRLQAQIDGMLEQQETVTLGEVIRSHPLEQGLGELLAYLVIASRREGSEVREDEWQDILYCRDGREVAARCETIVFHRKRPDGRRHHAARKGEHA